MVSPRRVKRGIQLGVENPSIFLQEANRIYYQSGNDHNVSGVRVMERDWDMLVILDACRLDQFEAENTISGNLSSITSRGSHTTEWLRGNFTNQQYHDTVYVTASPQLYRWNDEINASFHAIQNVWQTHTTEPPGVVLPADMVRQVEQAADEYPNKRILAHFMQPHYPFIAEEYRHLNSKSDDDPDIWNRLRQGDLDASPEEIDSALRSNLRLALPPVSSLVAGFDGKTVVSADHGNLLNERIGVLPYREWGHPPGLHVPTLVQVPWLEIEARTRRRVVAESPHVDVEDVEEEAEDAVEQRLRDLGYA